MIKNFTIKFFHLNIFIKMLFMFQKINLNDKANNHLKNNVGLLTKI